MEHTSLTVTPPNGAAETEQISRAVVETVAEADSVDPIDLTPLYTAIDPDALEALFRPRLGSAGDAVSGEIRFSYHGYEVRVTAAGEVSLADTPDR